MADNPESKFELYQKKRGQEISICIKNLRSLLADQYVDDDVLYNDILSTVNMCRFNIKELERKYKK